MFIRMETFLYTRVYSKYDVDVMTHIRILEVLDYVETHTIL